MWHGRQRVHVISLQNVMPVAHRAVEELQACWGLPPVMMRRAGLSVVVDDLDLQRQKSFKLAWHLTSAAVFWEACSATAMGCHTPRRDGHGSDKAAL